MHIAASKPKSLSIRPACRLKILPKSVRLPRVKAAESGKPAEIVAKMVEGSVAKYLKGSVPVDQPFVKRRQADHRSAG